MLKPSGTLEKNTAKRHNRVTEQIAPGDPRFGIISEDPERMSGLPCFAGTRVPVKNLFDYLETGETLDDFLEGFPGVSREQAATALRMAYDALIRPMSKSLPPR
jgi:uncharacterized protein (DUF433 family)